MEKAQVDEDGRLDLGVVARAAGYRPGTLVEIVVLSTGSLLITPDDSPVMLEIKIRRLAASDIVRRLPSG